MEGQFPLLWCENRRINGSRIKAGVKTREAISLSKVIISPSAMTKSRLYKADRKLQFLLQQKWTNVLLWWHSQLCNHSIYVLRAIFQRFLQFVLFFWATNILTTMSHTSIITAVRRRYIRTLKLSDDKTGLPFRFKLYCTISTHR